MSDDKKIDKAEQPEQAQPGQSGEKPMDDPLLKMLAQLVASSQSAPAGDKAAKPMDDYKFWKTQPVPRLDAQADGRDGEIEHKTTAQVAIDAQKLPSGFKWSQIDVMDEAQLDEVYQLLFDNYIEDSSEKFRFKYSVEFLKWALRPPGWQPEWSVGIRAEESNKLLAFISGVPAEMSVRKKDVHGVEINFLCVHKKLRSKRMAPVLIKEITRQCNLKGVWQALFTAGTLLPTPISTTRYYHRPLDWQKLYDVGFSYLPPGTTASEQVKKHEVPATHSLTGFRKMTAEDIPAVHKLYNAYISKFDLSQVFTVEELTHYLISSSVHAYVVENASHEITDFVSFYVIESSVLGDVKHDHLTIGFAYYYGTTASGDKLKERLIELQGAALIEAKKLKFDVFNALTLLDNPLFLEALKFGPGDGLLYYNLFNFKTLPISGGIDAKGELSTPGGIGIVLL